MIKKAFDLRTCESVVVIGEVAGHKLFAGSRNKPLPRKKLQTLAARLGVLCREHGIDGRKLGLSLMNLGEFLCADARKKDGR